MKKISLVLLMAMMCLTSFSQEKITNYENQYTGKDYDVYLSLDENDKYSLFVDMMSMDNLIETGGMLIDEKKHVDFLNTLSKVKEKYVNWVKTAKENNVENLNKTIPFEIKVDGYFLYGGEWFFDFNVYLTFDIKIIDGSEYLLIARTGELTSSSNEYITHDGFVLVFTNGNYVDEFVNLLSVKNVEKHTAEKENSENLFK